jgi:hypothetical protein
VTARAASTADEVLRDGARLAAERLLSAAHR